MARVTLYQNLERTVAHLPTVVGAVRATAKRGQAGASAVLAAHRHTGDAEITVTHGDVDAFVNLDDSRGQQAAAAIEFGRSGGARGPSQGIGALSKAF